MTTTTVAKQGRAPGWMRWGFEGSSKVAPGLTAALTQRLLFLPIKARPRPAEQAVLARAERFSLGSSADGTRVEGYGWGEGQRVLLVHGWGGHAGQWAGLVEPLVKSGHRVVALDLPGHGASGTGRVSLVHFRRALLQVASHLGPFEAVVAHSLGAAATVLALEAGLSAQRLVFLAPPARFATIWGQAQARLGVSDAVMAQALERAQAWLGVRFEDLELLPKAAAQRAPLTVLHSRDDRELPFTEGEALAAAWPGARLEPLEGLGHLRLLRDPAVLEQVVARVRSA